jgi:hypothetical protein
MKRHVGLLIVFVVSAAWVLSAQTVRTPVVDIYLLRTAEQLQPPHVVTYRVAEWAQMRGRWIFPDIGYYDTGYGKEQIWFTGAGADVLHRKHIDWEQELYFSQEAGPESKGRRSLWIWPVLDFRFRTRLTGQLAAYPTIPLNHAQRWGYDIDRSKLEWATGSRWRAGAGYAGGICTSRTWQNNPFVTVTRTTRIGNVEVWLQRIAGGAQVQLRYFLAQPQKEAQD